MDTVGQISTRIARRYCEREHQGATPCPSCAYVRAVASEAIHEFLECLVAHVVHRHRSQDAPS